MPALSLGDLTACCSKEIIHRAGLLCQVFISEQSLLSSCSGSHLLRLMESFPHQKPSGHLASSLPAAQNLITTHLQRDPKFTEGKLRSPSPLQQHGGLCSLHLHAPRVHTASRVLEQAPSTMPLGCTISSFLCKGLVAAAFHQQAAGRCGGVQGHPSTWGILEGTRKRRGSGCLQV